MNSKLSLMALAALLVSSCKSDEARQPNGLAGYWTLTERQCNCPPNTPTPNEALEFDGNGKVTKYENGQVKQTGTYQLSTGAAACDTSTSVVTFAFPDAPEPQKAKYTLEGRVLVIDHGICFDAPRYTYTYAPRGSR